MVKNVIPLEHISRGITFLYMKKVAITNGSISYIPKNERQEWFMRTTFFYPLHADLLGPVKIYAQNYLQAPAE